jgi:hypothetical protein
MSGTILGFAVKDLPVLGTPVSAARMLVVQGSGPDARLRQIDKGLMIPQRATMPTATVTGFGAGTVVWTFTTPFPAGLKPTVQATLEETTIEGFKATVVEASETRAVVRVWRETLVALGALTLAFQNGKTVHLQAAAPTA